MDIQLPWMHIFSDVGWIEFLHLPYAFLALRKAQQVDTQEEKQVSYSNWNPFPQAQGIAIFQEP